jgi:hypothetical protein
MFETSYIKELGHSNLSNTVPEPTVQCTVHSLMPDIGKFIVWYEHIFFI